MEKKAVLVKFGNAVRSVRNAAGISQEELADRTEIHRTYIGGIERGERNPTLIMIARIAKALSIPVSHLIQLTENKGNESRQTVE
jgi:transcriptional regulator with XRE-family HTH domain